MNQPPPPGARRQRSSGWPFYLVLGLVILAIPVGYLYFLGEDAPPPPPPRVAAPLAPRPTELRLSEVSGKVEIRRANGEWEEARAGEALKTSDAVRTGESSHAVLLGGERYEVKLESGTEVSVDELTESISRVLLGSGMATARVKGEAKHTFEVKAQGSDAVARTRAGTFTVSNNANGTVAVGTKEGEVEFTGAGKVVIVRAGQQSVIRPGHGPSDPAAIPTSLLLKVRWPTTRELAKKKLVLTGTVEPGARLEVAGQPITVDGSGQFSIPVRLAEGRNTLKVRARSVGGLMEESTSEVNVDTTPPSMGVDKDLWK
ncbi:MAG: FecR domain-containing protein [Myxococcota bacterium]|nr:FecR domain-containing protein [Myxococcota bacterium]